MAALAMHFGFFTYADRGSRRRAAASGRGARRLEDRLLVHTKKEHARGGERTKRPERTRGNQGQAITAAARHPIPTTAGRARRFEDGDHSRVWQGGTARRVTSTKGHQGGRTNHQEPPSEERVPKARRPEGEKQGGGGAVVARRNPVQLRTDHSGSTRPQGYSIVPEMQAARRGYQNGEGGRDQSNDRYRSDASPEYGEYGDVLEETIRTTPELGERLWADAEGVTRYTGNRTARAQDTYGGCTNTLSNVHPKAAAGTGPD